MEISESPYSVSGLLPGLASRVKKKGVIKGGTPRGAGTGGGVVGAACPHNSGAVVSVPPQLFKGLGTVGAVVFKLGVVGHKGKLNEKKHFSEIFHWLSSSVDS